MGALMRPLLLAALLLPLACGKHAVDRAEWRSMSHEARVLYVKSLVGEEQAREAKGGAGRAYREPAEEYVKRIEAAYAAGDRREPREIFGTLPAER